MVTIPPIKMVKLGMVYYCFTNIITSLSSGTPMLIHPGLTFRGSLSIRLDIAAWSSTSHLTKSLCVYVNTRNHNSIDRRWPASGKVDSQRWTVWPSLTSAASPSFPTRIANWHPKLRCQCRRPWVFSSWCSTSSGLADDALRVTHI